MSALLILQMFLLFNFVSSQNGSAINEFVAPKGSLVLPTKDLNFMCCNCQFNRDTFDEICLQSPQNTSAPRQEFDDGDLRITQTQMHGYNLSIKIAEFATAMLKASDKWEIEWICCKQTILTNSNSNNDDKICIRNFVLEQTALAESNHSFPVPNYCHSIHLSPEQRVDFILVCLTLISIGLLSLTILTYMSLPLLLNIHGKSIVCHLICLELSYIIQTLQYFYPNRNHNSEENSLNYCFALGLGFYGTSLGALFWLCIINVDIWHTFTLVILKESAEDSWDSRKRFGKYSIVGFGAPIVLSCLVLILKLVIPEGYFWKPDITGDNARCFFSTTKGYNIVIYYYGLTAVIIAVNLIIFMKTNVVLCQLQSAVAKARESSTTAKSNFARVFLFFKLFCVMGTTWVINIVFWTLSHNQNEVRPAEKNWAARFFECFNVMHGFCYFVIFVCKPSIFRMLRKKWKNEDSQTLTTSKGFTASTNIKKFSDVGKKI